MRLAVVGVMVLATLPAHAWVPEDDYREEADGKVLPIVEMAIGGGFVAVAVSAAAASVLGGVGGLAVTAFAASQLGPGALVGAAGAGAGIVVGLLYAAANGGVGAYLLFDGRGRWIDAYVEERQVEAPLEQHGDYDEDDIERRKRELRKKLKGGSR